jgi:glycosyltransferase involved in cell wall biosynthesis
MMFCSTIIATINRPTLARTVNSVINQDFRSDNHELIVVNDSGNPLTVGEWQESSKVTILETQRRERSVARNTGAAIAKGRYFHFIDDDDWLMPGALQAFWEIAEKSNKEWLYGGTQLVDRNGKELIQLEHGLRGNCFSQVMAGEWIPMQSSIISSELFFQISGFTPSLSATEDIDLCRRIALNGEFDFTEKIVACVEMGHESSTTNYTQAEVATRDSRERILDQPGVFNRLRDSARTNSMAGRMVRIYLTSAVWNLRNQNFEQSIRRLGFALLSFLYSGKSIFQAGYWQAIGNPYTSDTFLRGFREAGLPVTSR